MRTFILHTHSWEDMIEFTCSESFKSSTTAVTC
jgi:hypothetical protein